MKLSSVPAAAGCTATLNRFPTAHRRSDAVDLHPARPEHGNAGIPAHDLALLKLTKLGWRQSRDVAAGWTETPSLIVTSPYLRTQQTAAATTARFPDVPVEVWPIQEFTCLRPSKLGPAQRGCATKRGIGTVELVSDLAAFPFIINPFQCLHRLPIVGLHR